jgi:hypothetical protein
MIFHIIQKHKKMKGAYFTKVLEVVFFSLITLDVSGCFQVDDGCVVQILEKCQHLEFFNIRNCRKITNVSLESIVMQKASSLKSLNIGGNFNITVSGLHNFVNNSSHKLSNLQLAGLPITDELVVNLASKFALLTCLNISYSNIKEDTLIHICKVLGKQLSSLNVSWHSCQLESVNPQFSFGCFIELMTMYCRRLVELDISGIRSLGVVHILRLVELKSQQANDFPGEWFPFLVVHAKFLASSKQQLESALVPSYPSIRFVL